MDSSDSTDGETDGKTSDWESLQREQRATTELVADGGDAKVVGHHTAAAGETYGVKGEVDSDDGYGLYTPDDASVEGVLEVATLGGALTGGATLEDIAGANLAIEDGVLNASVENGGGDGSNWELVDVLLEPAVGEGIDVFEAHAQSVETNTVESQAIASTSIESDEVEADTVDTDALTGTLTGGATLEDIAGANLAIENGVLNASVENGNDDGIQTLTGGGGIDPDDISDGDELSVAWQDAVGLLEDGSIDWENADALDGTGALDADAVDSDAIQSDAVNSAEIAPSAVDSDEIAPSAVGSDELADTVSLEQVDVDTISGGVTDGDALTDIAGDNLDIEGGELRATVDETNAGRYLEDHDGTRNFTGPAEWENAGDTETNEVHGRASTVGGGEANVAGDADDDDETHATVSGGEENTANGQYATVGGGEDNTASGSWSVVDGGVRNETIGRYSTIGGGENNEASAWRATVGGGWLNTASESRATVCGGLSNEASGTHATVGGGSGNDASADNATVGGGNNNEASGNWATVAGGGSNESEDGNVAVTNHSTVGGGEGNVAGDEEYDEGAYTTVGGGRNNEARGFRATVGGGEENVASTDRATVGGGAENEATGVGATIGGGTKNLASLSQATVGGGIENVVNGFRATVGGGQENEASGHWATVPGGWDNDASGDYSVAAGREAKAEHDGAFVFGDSTETPLSSEEEDTAYFQMPIEADDFVNNSSAAMKENIEPFSPETALNGIAELSISTWEFTHREGEHIGPMAEDFHEQFGVGDDKTISNIDATGIAFAAIQGLVAELETRDERIDELEGHLAERDNRLDELESRLAALEADT